MWVKSKWFIASFSLVFTAGALADDLMPSDLGNPERVLEYLKAASAHDRESANKLYAHAQKAKSKYKSDHETKWGSTLKHSWESAMIYPTGKAYLLLVEAELRYAPVRIILERASRHLDSAVAVEAYERSLDDAGQKKLVFYRDCVKRYLDNGKMETGCAPVEWAGLRK
jgi:hypothetical protein